MKVNGRGDQRAGQSTEERKRLARGDDEEGGLTERCNDHNTKQLNRSNSSLPSTISKDQSLKRTKPSYHQFPISF
jgi:hypothetical protein